MENLNGIFAVNKPRGMTSHDVVNIVRRKTSVKRVGHGGTLDPLAEGILVIAVGRENTKKLDQYVKGEKEYLATLKLGYISETDDADGPIHEYNNYMFQKLASIEVPPQSASKIPEEEQIKHCLKKFIGNIQQVPPIYSSIKLRGKPAHRRVRRGETVEMKSRPVFIKRITLDQYCYPEVKIKVTCGPGVYIRSLARDIGNELKVGAYLSKLIRTKVGKFTLKSSVDIEKLVARS